MATGVTTQTGFDENAYLTLAEYKNAPTSIDFDNLVVGGNAAAQDAELLNMITRASSYLNEYLNQDLTASVKTETQRLRITPQGFISLHPFHGPVLSLSAFSYGSDPNNLMALSDPSKCWFEDQQIIIPLSQMSSTYSSQGPLSFGGASPRTPLFVKYTYIAGYVNTTILSATASASSFTVNDASGFLPGEQYRISDGAISETITVSTSYVYGSTTITTASPLTSSHANGVAVGNLPFAIKQACVLATTGFIKMRGDNSLTMSMTTSANANVDGAKRYGSEMALALQMVDLYRRVR